jgi:ribosomal protein L32
MMSTGKGRSVYVFESMHLYSYDLQIIGRRSVPDLNCRHYKLNGHLSLIVAICGYYSGPEC